MYDIYVKDGENIRYVLGTKGDKTLTVFGINPSTATDEKSDPTISRLNTYLKKYGFDSFKMLNICPLRATYPDSLPPLLDGDVHKRNLAEIKSALADTSAILCAWGNLIFKRQYLPDCFKDISEIISQSQIPVYCLGKTNSGNPRHPLARVKTPEQLAAFDIDGYVNRLLK